MSTKFTEKIAINAAGGEVVFDGVDFTANAYVEIRNANSLTIRNCRFYQMNLPDAKNYLIKAIGDIPCKLVIEKCFFGACPSQGGNQMFNLIELNAKLKAGSSISKNYFAKDACTHNYIGLYGMADNGSFYLDENVFACNGAVRIGIKEEPVCKLYCRKNVVESRTEGFVDNFLLFQPYGTKTTSFANCVVVCDGNQIPSGKFPIAYWNSASDLQLTPELLPVIKNNSGKDVTDQMWQTSF